MQSPTRQVTFPLSPVVENVPTLVNKTGLWRFLTPVRREKISPCRSLCPLESGIPLWMEQVRRGNWEKAWQIMEQYNPFPALTGYACYEFCRSDCNRGRWDEPIAIREVEKAIGLWRQQHYQPAGSSIAGRGKPSVTGNEPPRVSIVGSGPAGLSCAYYLNRLGARVTVWEKDPLPGGLLATGIPGYRLPREILARELEILQQEDITIKTGYELGKDLALEDLAENCEAIVLALGAQQSKPLGVPGDKLAGVTGAVDFLREYHLECRSSEPEVVLVVGGGNAAVDAACAAKMGGAKEVIIVYRRSEEVMPAHPEEVKAAREAGVKFLFNVVLEEIHGNNTIEQVTLCRVQPAGRDEELRPIQGSAFTMECQLIIAATGQESVLTEHVSLPPQACDKESSIIKIDQQIYAAGDAVNGPSTIAAAIFSGRRAALLIGNKLGKYAPASSFPIAPALASKEDPVSFSDLNPYLYPHREVANVPQEEAARCFNCGICQSCGVCWAFCPDLAVEDKRGEYEFLLDYCKGCGICVSECPSGVLHMEEVADPGTQIDER